MRGTLLLAQILFGGLFLGGCSSASHRTVEQGSAIAQSALGVDGAQIIITSIYRGTSFRIVQRSKVVSLEAEVRRPEGGPVVVSGKLGDHGEWFTGKNLAATASDDGEWVFFFRHYSPPVEGRLVFKEHLGAQGGWSLISKKDLPLDQVVQYDYALIGAVNLRKGAVLGHRELEEFGLDPRSPLLRTQPSVVLGGSEVAVNEIPVKPMALPVGSK